MAAGYDEDSSNQSQSDFTEDEDDQGYQQGELPEEGLDADLKGQSLEQILSLKDSVGLRTYKTAIGLEDVGKSKTRRKKFRRENKNRPREISSKIPVSGARNIFAVKKKVRADPRFEEGFDEVQSRNKIKAEHRMRQRHREYSFLDDIRRKEKQELEEKLAEGTYDLDEHRKAQKLLQKIRSREVTQTQRRLRTDIDQKYSSFLKEARESGQEVKYMNKKDRKKAELISKYKELKKTGKLDKYLEKKRKKNASRDRKKMLQV
ncbi:ribosomal RNA processing protein 36 homolog [Galendromus occidentalis]|uniref:rRNA biogenesis protein RRP36 n=1 Tax=Galendromus occidentalis TaxID=34638 RepID=A0AAJ7L6P3_9ACAR|nr:ribosomal RNA processing protein 36 homolog [Galendromus occidentalis]